MILSRMSEKIKTFAKGRPFILNSYLTYMVFRRMLVKDIFNFEKIALFWKIAPYTMTNYNRLSQIYEFARMFEERGTKGAFVECGTWRGGGTGIMAYCADKEKQGREVWVFDAFEGLPAPTTNDGTSGRKGYRINERFSMEDVKYLLFRKLKLNRDTIHIEKGWFQDTLPASRERIGAIAILRLDCDLYESNKCCLENLYQNVIKGGCIIINTYDSWEGTRGAIDEFLERNRINAELKKIDYGGRYFRKP